MLTEAQKRRTGRSRAAVGRRPRSDPPAPEPTATGCRICRMRPACSSRSSGAASSAVASARSSAAASLADEVARCAADAASEDPRFPPVTERGTAGARHRGVGARTAGGDRAGSGHTSSWAATGSSPSRELAPRPAAAPGGDRVGLDGRAVPAARPASRQGFPATPGGTGARICRFEAEVFGEIDASTGRPHVHRRRIAARRRSRERLALRRVPDLHEVGGPVARPRVAGR